MIYCWFPYHFFVLVRRALAKQAARGQSNVENDKVVEPSTKMTVQKSNVTSKRAKLSIAGISQGPQICLDSSKIDFRVEYLMKMMIRIILFQNYSNSSGLDRTRPLLSIVRAGS
jgi:hypothetical protein